MHPTAPSGGSPCRPRRGTAGARPRRHRAPRPRPRPRRAPPGTGPAAAGPWSTPGWGGPRVLLLPLPGPLAGAVGRELPSGSPVPREALHGALAEDAPSGRHDEQLVRAAQRGQGPPVGGPHQAGQGVVARGDLPGGARRGVVHVNLADPLFLAEPEAGEAL